MPDRLTILELICGIDYQYIYRMLTLKRILSWNLNAIGQHCDCKYRGDVL